MKIIISPAKSFKKNKGFETEDLIFPQKTKILVEKFQKYTMNEIGNLNRTNDKLTEKAYYDYQEFDFNHLENPAIFAYDGLVFKQFGPSDFDDIDYLNNHLYIISALYGLLKPLTGISDYRLYFDNNDINLYEFWDKDIYNKLYEDNDMIINLASKEYTKTIRPFLKDSDRFVTIDFKDFRNGKLKSVVAWMKQMRGLMVKEIIKNKIENLEDIKDIAINGYIFDPSISKEDNLVFVRNHQWDFCIYQTYIWEKILGIIPLLKTKNIA